MATTKQTELAEKIRAAVNATGVKVPKDKMPYVIRALKPVEHGLITAELVKLLIEHTDNVRGLVDGLKTEASSAIENTNQIGEALETSLSSLASNRKKLPERISEKDAVMVREYEEAQKTAEGPQAG